MHAFIRKCCFPLPSPSRLQMSARARLCFGDHLAGLFCFSSLKMPRLIHFAHTALCLKPESKVRSNLLFLSPVDLQSVWCLLLFPVDVLEKFRVELSLVSASVPSLTL